MEKNLGTTKALSLVLFRVWDSGCSRGSGRENVETTTASGFRVWDAEGGVKGKTETTVYIYIYIEDYRFSVLKREWGRERRHCHRSIYGDKEKE